MKKTIFYLAFVLALALPKTALAFPSGGSGEGEQPDPGQGAGVHHEHPVDSVAEVAALRQQVDDLKALLEIQAQAQLQALQGLQGQPPLGDNADAPALSPHQQLLLARWEQGQIGERAWSALGGNRSSLANALSSALSERIEKYPGKKVDICFLGVNNFKLSLDGNVKQKLYMF